MLFVCVGQRRVAETQFVWYKQFSAALPMPPFERGRPIVPSPDRLPIGVPGWWLIAAFAAGITELLSPTFGFVFVSVAALAAAGVAALGLPFPAQLACFAAVVLLTLLFLRPRLARRLDAQGVPTRTQVLVGQVGQVTVPIDPVSGTGRVEVAGQDWAARSATSLSPGTRVRVEGADGIVLMVAPATRDDDSAKFST